MANKIKLPRDGSVQDGIQSFQKGDYGANAWMVFGYKGKNTLKIIDQGEGSVSNMVHHFTEGVCKYALIRKEWKVEMANTVKFAFISWTPTDIKPMRKAMLSIHRHSVKDILSPTHVQLEAEEISEINDSTINDKFGFSSGTKVHVTEQKEEPRRTKRGSIKRGCQGFIDLRAKSDSPNFQSKKIKKLTLVGGNEIPDAIAAVKLDSDKTNWLLVMYDTVKSLKLFEMGSGGIEEMISKLDDANVYYGYFRVNEKYDNSVTVKFGYLKLMSQKISTVERAKMSTHRGFITSLFSPSHVEFDIGDPSEIDEKSVMEKFGKASGTHSNITNKKETFMASKMRKNEKVEHSVVVSSNYKMSFVDKEAFMGALADVRDDSNDTDWMLGSYVKKNTLGLIGCGDGGLSELLDNLEEKTVNFGFFRVKETVDKSVTVKFVFVKWQPPGINMNLKAQIATKKGIIDELFTPWHVDFFIETKDEISDELVKDKVSAASGTKINITTGKEAIGVGQMR